jgi:NAD(P)-dependent dehydrogenase (short-subunit alcohol dehydrogenase family)
MAGEPSFSLEYFSLRGRTAMVTGANDGIGRGSRRHWPQRAGHRDNRTLPGDCNREAVRAHGRRHLDVVAGLDDVAGLPSVAKARWI